MDGVREGVSVLRVGVDDLEDGRMVGVVVVVVELPGVCGREVGVEGLVGWVGLDGVGVGVGRVLEGVEVLEGVVRVEDGVEGLAVLVGVEGLI